MQLDRAGEACSQPLDVTTSLPDQPRALPSPLPTLTRAHHKRLRTLFSYGRPVHVGQLGGVELDLLVLGLIAQDDTRHHHGSAVVKVTQAGIDMLNAERQRLVAAQRPHHDLAARLSAHLRTKGKFTWENVEFRNPSPVYVPGAWGGVRPDVFACLPSLRAERAAPEIYEVKVSRSDFLADLARPDKAGAYLDLAGAVYYCASEGLIKPAEVPSPYGLICERADGEFVLAKRARRQKAFVMAADTLITLMVKRQVPLGDDFPITG